MTVVSGVHQLKKNDESEAKVCKSLSFNYIQRVQRSELWTQKEANYTRPNW